MAALQMLGMHKVSNYLACCSLQEGYQNNSPPKGRACFWWSMSALTSMCSLTCRLLKLLAVFAGHHG